MSYYPPPGGYPGYPPQGAYPPPYGQSPYPPQYGQPPSGYPPQGYPQQGYPPPYGHSPQYGQPPPAGYPTSGHAPPPEGHHPPHQQAQQGGAPPAAPPAASVPTLVNLLGAQYVLPYETTLVMRELYNWSRDDMDIMDIRGILQFRLRAKLISVHKKRSIYNNSGNAICSTMQKVLSMKANTYICPGGEPSESTRVAEVKKVVFSLTPQAHVFFRGNKSSNPDILVRGNFMERSFQICNQGGGLLAEVTRDIFSVASQLAGLDTYYLRVFPGVDTALMVTLVTIIEEMFVEQGQGEGTGWVN